MNRGIETTELGTRTHMHMHHKEKPCIILALMFTSKYKQVAGINTSQRQITPRYRAKEGRQP